METKEKEKEYGTDKIQRQQTLTKLFKENDLEKFIKSKKIKYDDILDSSDFKPSRELIRDRSGSNSGEIEQGVYDYKKGTKITKENIVTDVELALRNGKLDKADIQKMNEMLDQELSKQAETAKEKQELEKAEKATKNRQKKLDEMLDVNQETE